MAPSFATMARAQMMFVRGRTRPARWNWQTLWHAIFFNPRLALAMAIVTLVITNLLLFGAIGTTLSVAQASLPGDMLYPTKVAAEGMQLALSFNSSAKAQRQLEFARNRVDEMRALVDMDRPIELPGVVRSFQLGLDQLSAAIDVVATQDPAAARGLEQRAVDALSQYTTSLSALKHAGPASVRPMIEPAIQASELKRSGFLKRLEKQAPAPVQGSTPTPPRMRTPTPAPNRSPAVPNRTPVSVIFAEPDRL